MTGHTVTYISIGGKFDSTSTIYVQLHRERIFGERLAGRQPNEHNTAHRTHVCARNQTAEKFREVAHIGFEMKTRWTNSTWPLSSDCLVKFMWLEHLTNGVQYFSRLALSGLVLCLGFALNMRTEKIFQNNKSHLIKIYWKLRKFFFFQFPHFNSNPRREDSHVAW